MGILGWVHCTGTTYFRYLWKGLFGVKAFTDSRVAIVTYTEEGRIKEKGSLRVAVIG
jgi:hypothetical protein